MGTILTQAASDLDVMFADFGETVTYNGVSISAIYEDWNDKFVGNSFGPAGQITLAWFWVAAADVADPVNGDSIVRDGVTWRVERILESMGGAYKLQASRGEGVWA